MTIRDPEKNMKTRMPAWSCALLLLLAALAAGCGEEEEQQASCTDGIENGDETGVDCGGSCGPCIDGEGCSVDEDCMSGFCHEQACASPGCEDGVRNADETDVDCGGPDCPPCAAGSSCEVGEDCVTGDCEEGVCAAPDECADGDLNGDESDVDCGGSCGPCANGKLCGSSADCASDYCSPEGLCADPPACDDEDKNGEETDIDCGGPDCPPCPEHYTCEVNSDCLLGVCKDGICDATEDDSCENGVKDGDETDKDCGGSCPPCLPGFGCEEFVDCQSSGFVFIDCVDGICGGLATCDNYSQDGHETDVDCGGPYCYPCGEGGSCDTGEDCASGTCDQGACTQPDYTCDNGVKDGYEADIDCGGPACSPCQDGYACMLDSDCDSWCNEGACGEACIDGSLNGHETDIDCGGGLCSPCELGKSCLENEDCLSSVCSEGICGLASTCGDGSLNDQETDVDCGGPACVPCEVGDTCLADGDCVTGSCSGGQCVHTVRYLQGSDASMSCDAPGASVTISLNVMVSPVAVVSGSFSLGESTMGFYVAEATGREQTHEYSGILVAVDSTLGVSVATGDIVSVTGDYVEDDCMSVLMVSDPNGVSPASTPIMSPIPFSISASIFENGGSADAELWESVLVRVEQTVTDVSGFTGPEAPGQPSWWFKMGTGIYVANDFGLTNLPQEGAAMVVQGAVKHSRGVYLIVPRTEDDIFEQGGLPPRP